MQKFSDWSRLAFFVVWTLVGVMILIVGVRMAKDRPYGMMGNAPVNYPQGTQQGTGQTNYPYRQNMMQQQVPAQGSGAAGY